MSRPLMSSSFRGWLAVGIIALSLAGCKSEEGRSWRLLENPRPERKDGVIVFVHGFEGHYEKTWGKFPDLLLGDPKLHFDVFLWGYPTSLLHKNPSLSLLGDELKTELAVRLNKYQRVYLVGHSLGGLVIQTMVIDALKHNEAAALAAIRHIFLLATPNQGIQLPGIIKLVNRTGYSIDVGSKTVNDLRVEWIDRVYNPVIRPGETASKRRIPVTVVVGRDDGLVDEMSARSFFRHPPPRTVAGDHTTMKEPQDDRSDTIYLVIQGQVLKDLEASTPQVPDFATVRRQLVQSIYSAQKTNPPSGFTLNIPISDSVQQVWATAQALKALLSTHRHLPLSAENLARLKPALRYIMGAREKHGGWARYEGKQESVVDVTSHVGLALLEALQAPGFLEPGETQSVNATVEFIGSLLRDLQSTHHGGWSHLHMKDPVLDSITPYSTWIALEFLLELRRVRGTPGLDVPGLDDVISRGLHHVLGRFVSSGSRGWEDGRGEGLVYGLWIINLLLLEDARQSGFDFVGGHLAYRTAKADWIQRINARILSDGLDLQEFVNQPARLVLADGKTQYVHSGAALLYFPWTLLLLKSLLHSPQLREEEPIEYADVVAAWNTQVRRLPEYAALVSAGATFRPAETLYVLNRFRAPQP